MPNPNELLANLSMLMDAGPDRVRIKVGIASITLKADGTLELAGVRLDIKAEEVRIVANGLTSYSEATTLYSGDRRVRFSLDGAGNADLHCKGAMIVRGDLGLELRSKGRNLTTAHRPAHGAQPAGTGNTW
jgi:hypothetical protein